MAGVAPAHLDLAERTAPAEAMLPEESVPNFVVAQISPDRLWASASQEHDLLEERQRLLLLAVRAPKDLSSLDEKETHYLSRLIEGGQILVRHLSEPLPSTQAPLLRLAKQQLTEAAFYYIHHRRIGIEEHLNTGNVHTRYGSKAAFERHASFQREAFGRFYRDPTVRRIVLLLGRLAPSLKHPVQTFPEMIEGGRNQYEEMGTRFFAPPALAEILRLLRGLSAIESRALEGDLRLAVLEELCATTKTLAFYKNTLQAIEFCRLATLFETVAVTNMQLQGEFQIRQWMGQVGALLTLS